MVRYLKRNRKKMFRKIRDGGQADVFFSAIEALDA